MSQAKKQVVLGHVYSVAVGGSYLPVRADKSLGHGRYEGATIRPDGPGSTVKFTGDRVRGDGMPEAEWRARRAVKPAEEPAQPVQKPDATRTKPAKKPAAEAKQRKTAKAGTPVKERKPSGLDAAVRVLREAGKPMHCGDVVKTALEKGYWQTNGKTPAATIYAAIIREIAVKGGQSRFRKTDRGMFELTAAGKEAK
jgi:hypothetical protein